MMDSPSRYGLLAVFSVSGSIAFLFHHLHKRLVSDFMDEFEFQISAGNCEKGQGKKKKKKNVRFAEVEEVKGHKRRESKDVMPLNGAALYRGIIKHRSSLRF